ncbi:MAG TPA: ArsA-related P-loop ATPase [Baekduia sp.]|nr:ArsA-related P-loop ATPase [Baekduia sp.]
MRNLPHLAFAGKGGAGKSVLAATVARLLARDGEDVLALDTDPLLGLTRSLGAAVPQEAPLQAAAEQDEQGRWRLRPGIGTFEAVRRFATAAPEGVRLLQVGRSGREGPAAALPAAGAFNAVVHGIRDTPELATWSVVGDLSAGTRQTALGWAPYADRFVLVVEPTWQSILTARRIARIAGARGDVDVLLVVNKAADASDAARVQDAMGLRAAAVVPADDALREAERAGAALLDAAAEAASVRALHGLVATLRGSTVAGR